MKKTLLLVFFSACFYFIQGQEVVSSAGDYHEGTNASISWTLGEVAIETLEGSNATLTQGFQQSYEVNTVIDEISEMKFNLKVYPNPSSDFLKITVQNTDKPDLLLSLTDLSGKVLMEENLQNLNHQIDLRNYSSGTYLLHIQDLNSNKANTYKIVKIN